MSSGEPLSRRIGMNVICADGPGSPDVLTLSQRPTPDPEPGQVLVRVSSASVNFSDVMRRRGDPYPIPTTWPYTPGSEIAGTVERLGDGVDAALRGKTVFALAGDDASGGYAQYALCRAETAIPVPEGVTADQASTLVVAGVTPMLMLTEASTVGPGSTVLVQAAGGGVGGFAVAIARALGATVIACGGTQEHCARASELGADHVVDTSAPRWSERVLAATGGRGVDVALEGAANRPFLRPLRRWHRSEPLSYTVSPAAKRYVSIQRRSSVSSTRRRPINPYAPSISAATRLAGATLSPRHSAASPSSSGAASCFLASKRFLLRPPRTHTAVSKRVQ